MKKQILTLLVALIILSGCSLLGSDAKQETKTATSSTTADSSVQTVQTKRYRYEVKTESGVQVHVDTITFQGSTITQLRQQVTAPLFNAETVASLQGQNFVAVKPELLAVLEQEELTTTLRSVAGVSQLSFDIAENYDVVTDITIDMTTADFAALAKNSGFGLDLTNLKGVTAKQYIARMKIRLAQEEAVE